MYRKKNSLSKSALLFILALSLIPNIQSFSRANLAPSSGVNGLATSAELLRLPTNTEKPLAARPVQILRRGRLLDRKRIRDKSRPCAMGFPCVGGLSHDTRGLLE